MTVVLSNGLVVANFSSNHAKFNPESNVAFTFEDGSQLLNVDANKSIALSLQMVDDSSPSSDGRYNKVIKGFKLTPIIIDELEYLHSPEGPELEVDLILVPFPMLQALKNEGYNYHKCCTASVDRSTGKCSIQDFCFL